MPDVERRASLGRAPVVEAGASPREVEDVELGAEPGVSDVDGAELDQVAEQLDPLQGEPVVVLEPHELGLRDEDEVSQGALRLP